MNSKVKNLQQIISKRKKVMDSAGQKHRDRRPYCCTIQYTVLTNKERRYKTKIKRNRQDTIAIKEFAIIAYKN